MINGLRTLPLFDTVTYLQKVEVTEDVQNLKKLLADRIDLAVMDRATFEFYMRTNPDLIPEQGKLEFMEPPIYAPWNYYAVSKKVNDYQLLLEAMNTGIRLIKEDGTLEKIMTDVSYQIPLK